MAAAIHLFHEGQFIGPFVYPRSYELNMTTLKREYTEDTTRPVRMRFFCTGEAYYLMGFIPGNRHLYCVEEGETFEFVECNFAHDVHEMERFILDELQSTHDYEPPRMDNGRSYWNHRHITEWAEKNDIGFEYRFNIR